MRAHEGGRQAFVVARQTTKARRPTKGAFHDPASVQEHKAALGFSEFHHLQAYAVSSGGCGGFGPV